MNLLIQDLRSVGLSDGIPVAFIAADVLEKLEEAFAPVRDWYDTGKIYNPTSEDRPDHEYDIFIAMLSAAVADLQISRDDMFLEAAKEHIETLEAKLAKVQNGLVDLMEDQDAILPELRTLCDILTAPNRKPKEPTGDDG